MASKSRSKGRGKGKKGKKKDKKPKGKLRKFNLDLFGKLDINMYVESWNDVSESIAHTNF
jgi:hypothetical protein